MQASEEVIQATASAVGSAEDQGHPLQARACSGFLLLAQPRTRAIRHHRSARPSSALASSTRTLVLDLLGLFLFRIAVAQELSLVQACGSAKSGIIAANPCSCKSLVLTHPIGHHRSARPLSVSASLMRTLVIVSLELLLLRLSVAQ